MILGGMNHVEKPEALRPSPRVDLYLELAGLISGLLLVIILWLHTFLVATVIIGAPVFDGVARFLERYYITHTAIGLGLLFGLVHVISVSRRIPTAYRARRAVWRVAGRMRHADTFV